MFWIAKVAKEHGCYHYLFEMGKWDSAERVLDEGKEIAETYSGSLVEVMHLSELLGRSVMEVVEP